MNKYILYTNTKEIHGESIDNDKIFNREIGSFLESYEMNADCGVFLSHTRVSYITAAFINEVDENGDFVDCHAMTDLNEQIHEY